MTCPDLCTAAKCEELEARISALEQALELVEAAFEAHVSQDIPEAHNYIPDPSVGLFFNEGILQVFVGVDGRFTSDRVAIALDTFVAFDIFPIEDDRWEFVVTVNGDSDSDVLSIELPEEKPPSNLQIDGSFQENTLFITVADGESQDTAQIEIPLPEANEHSSSNLSLSASYFGNILTISVADGESSDTAQVFIDPESTTFVINEGDEVNCDNLSNDINNLSNNITQEIQNCCSQILAAIDNLEFQVQQVEREITIDISDTINSDYQCVEDTETQTIQPQLTPTSYGNKGLLGLHEHLKIMSRNLDEIFKPLCDVQNETVVSIVASPKYVTNVKDKVLILHFVTLDNYPKRQAGSYPRPIQIPGAKENYDWLTDFLNLRWFTGNQYAELELQGYGAKVSGWFADNTAANNYFDAVLNLTTATEINRNFPNHSNPRTDIAVVETRPYRAFIESVDASGTAICHAKYVPVEP